MFAHRTDERRRHLLLASLLVMSGEALFGYASYRLFGTGALPIFSLLHILIGGVVAGWSLRRRQISDTAALLSGIFLIAPFFPITVYNHYLLSAGDYIWAPFLGIKAIVVAMAMVVPAGVRLNLAFIAAFAVEVLILWYWLELGSNPYAAVAGEPLFTFIFLLISSSTLIFRERSASYARRLIESEARTRALTEMASVFLHVRDRANTPLQNILTATELLERKHPADKDLTMPILESVGELHELSNRLRYFEPYIEWEEGLPQPSKPHAEVQQGSDVKKKS